MKKEEIYNELEKIIFNETPKYFNLYNKNRIKYINNNKHFKKINKKIYIKKLFTIKKISPLKENQLKESLTYTQSNYCYPYNENKIIESKYILEFIEPFDNFFKYNKFVNKEVNYLTDFYHFFPKFLDQKELINNKNLIIWFFICFIKYIFKNNNNEVKNNYNILNEDKIKKEDFNIEKIKLNHIFIIEIINTLSNIIQKDFKYVYFYISKYIINIEKFIKKELNKNLNPCINETVKCFCPLCFKYLCRKHFYNYIKEIKNIENIDSKFIIKNFIKTSSPNKIYFNILDNNTNIDNEVCPIFYSKSCKKNDNINENNYKKINGNNNNNKIIKIISYINKKDLYFITCLIAYSNIKNSCFFARYFNYKYDCKLLNKLISIIYEENSIKYIEEQLKNYHPSLIFSEYKLKELLINKNDNYNLNADKNKHNKYKPIYKEIINLNRNFIPKNSKHKLYTPCSHQGICKLGFCSCINERGYCEKFCSCYIFGCNYLFTGCNCKNACFSKCKCFLNFRECDPDLCLHCKINNCENMKLYYYKYSKTFVKQSKICSSSGLFSNQDINKNELIGEYIGEMTEKDETERRSVIDSPFERNYVFELNNVFDIDAEKCGNKIRYINHASFGKDNCYSKKIYVRGDIKIAIFAKNNIKKNEELFFDYNMSNCDWIENYNKIHGKSN